jgi:hypothetical protein
VEDERAQAQYDLASGDMKVVLPKLNKGQVFEDLDLLTKLLLPKREIKKTPLIEVLDRQEDFTGKEQPIEEGKKKEEKGYSSSRFLYRLLAY